MVKSAINSNQANWNLHILRWKLSILLSHRFNLISIRWRLSLFSSQYRFKPNQWWPSHWLKIYLCSKQLQFSNSNSQCYRLLPSLCHNLWLILSHNLHFNRYNQHTNRYSRHFNQWNTVKPRSKMHLATTQPSQSITQLYLFTNSILHSSQEF